MIEEGTPVKVKGKQGVFTVDTIISDESGIIGYGVRDKDTMQHWYRENTVTPKKKKKRNKKKGRK